MGLSKTEIFTETHNQLALYAKVLGHPARVAIIDYLFKINTCFCGDLVAEIGLAQATISQHLKELKRIGIIKGNVDGTNVCYCIDADKWKEMKNTIGAFLYQDLRLNDQCC